MVLGGQAASMLNKVEVANFCCSNNQTWSIGWHRQSGRLPSSCNDLGPMTVQSGPPGVEADEQSRAPVGSGIGSGRVLQDRPWRKQEQDTRHQTKSDKARNHLGTQPGPGPTVAGLRLPSFLSVRLMTSSSRRQLEQCLRKRRAGLPQKHCRAGGCFTDGMLPKGWAKMAVEFFHIHKYTYVTNLLTTLNVFTPQQPSQTGRQTADQTYTAHAHVRQTTKQTDRQRDTLSFVLCAAVHAHARQTEEQTNSQTDGQTGKQTGKQDDAACARVRQTDRQTGKQDTLVNSKNKARTNSKTKKTSTQTKHRQTDTRTDRDTDREGKQQPTVTDLQAN